MERQDVLHVVSKAITLSALLLIGGYFLNLNSNIYAKTILKQLHVAIFFGTLIAVFFPKVHKYYFPLIPFFLFYGNIVYFGYYHEVYYYADLLRQKVNS